jgi:hypothetical protein
MIILIAEQTFLLIAEYISNARLNILAVTWSIKQRTPSTEST